MYVNFAVCVCVCECVSHLQELCGRQVYVGINNLKAGAQVLGA